MRYRQSDAVEDDIQPEKSEKDETLLQGPNDVKNQVNISTHIITDATELRSGPCRCQDQQSRWARQKAQLEEFIEELAIFVSKTLVRNLDSQWECLSKSSAEMEIEKIVRFKKRYESFNTAYRSKLTPSERASAIRHAVPRKLQRCTSPNERPCSRVNDIEQTIFN